MRSKSKTGGGRNRDGGYKRPSFEADGVRLTVGAAARRKNGCFIEKMRLQACKTAKKVV